MVSILSIEKERLLSLIEFSKQSTGLRGRPIAAISGYGLFSLYEHEIQGLPGIRLNISNTDNDEEIWLSIERLSPIRTPDVDNLTLLPWVEMSHLPHEEPRLLETVERAKYPDLDKLKSSFESDERDTSNSDKDINFKLSDYAEEVNVRTQFTVYLTSKWRPWAEEEKRRLKTINLYSKLFTLKQQLEGSIVDAQLEFIWGIGLSIWNTNRTNVCYPLIGRLVEITLNPTSAEIEIRPRDVDARIEIDWFASVDNPGVADLEKAAKKFFEDLETTFSPFDPSTFEPLLRTAASHLDAKGIYWPDRVPVEDRTIPKADEMLKVTNTWVLLARPRTNNLLLQDLARLKMQVDEALSYPPAITVIVTEPETTNPDIELPAFRGVNSSYQTEQSNKNTKSRDLYFPKPFNDEQVRIIQLLDISDGVVVQGPPGTGKTHTIANVICHYLAEGKRVLVTSMKDPALSVLQGQLPAEIRPLAISLLTSDSDGMKQFEHSIKKIASEVQGLDRSSTAKDITYLETSIDSLHGKIAIVDHKIGAWAKKNLEKIVLDTDEIEPQEAAREVIANANQFELIPDALGITPDFAPQFSDSDIVRFREARRTLGRDISYLESSLPQLVDFPDSMALLETHQDLSQFEKLKEDIAIGAIPTLSDSTQDTLSISQHLLKHIETLKKLRDEVANANRPWTVMMRERLKFDSNTSLIPMLETLGTELKLAVENRKLFLEKPVTIPVDIELDAEILEAIKNIAEGQRPFGLKGLFGKSTQKKQIDSIRILGNPPIDPDNWKYVTEYLALLKQLRELTLRWNVLAHELKIESVPAISPESGFAAAEVYDIYLNVKGVVKAEKNLLWGASRVFPNWPHASEVVDNVQLLVELEAALKHHLTKNRLASVWATKERFQKVLEGRTGLIIEKIRQFLADSLGNPQIEDVQIQAEWSELMSELYRVLSLGSHLITVSEVCSKIADSGAIQFAILLKQPLESTTDCLLPDNWRNIWRLRRLATYLESIDAQEELKKLATSRSEMERDLSRAYRDIVVKRTWLKLAENASPSIRAALQAYLNAIQKIGKGTGKRAVRYRQDARIAASHANSAVPCWIMSHSRVSESLPAELGCFDLVIIDEASQSDLTALPSLLRAKKVLIVGDDKQVSPGNVGLEEEKIRSLMYRFLGSQVETYRSQMSPDRSIYDLFKVVFAKSTVMLKEHFRCVGPIIEYSKREFYNHELRPLRVPKASERLDPPLIDVLIQDGYRKGDINQPEINFIVKEIIAIVSDHNMTKRTIGIVTLLGNKQSQAIWDHLNLKLGAELIQRHNIKCGDARTFQGEERDIMFLSMVTAPNEVGAPLSQDTFDQIFNVAASRAKNRMYLVRSVEIDHLSKADRLRRSLIEHFVAPFTQDEARVQDLRELCESPFEREMYDELTQRGYWVTPQIKVGQFRIDMVVEGNNDARLAIECDGDQFHGADKWADDMQRQRILERAGWVFWRCFASAFVRRRKEVLADLIMTLTERGIEPLGVENAPRSVHVEHRVTCTANDE